MTGTRFESRSSEWAGDLTVWLRAHAEDNGEQMERLQLNSKTHILTQ